MAHGRTLLNFLVELGANASPTAMSSDVHLINRHFPPTWPSTSADAARVHTGWFGQSPSICPGSCFSRFVGQATCLGQNRHSQLILNFQTEANECIAHFL